MDAMGYTIGDYIPCEISGSPANDIHHIIGRGKGGDDRIENLMSISRRNHQQYGDKVKYMKYLLMTHKIRLIEKGVKFDNDWFEKRMEEYSNRSEMRKV